MEFKITITEEDIRKYPNNYELGAFIRKKYSQYLNVKFDKCISCGLETPYLESTPVGERVGYVEGIGQDCFQPGSHECWQPENI
jgi:hypothetical protein